MTGLFARSQFLYRQIAASLDVQARRYGLVDLLLDTWQAYSQHEMTMLAAALAYYLLLALFPLMLLLIAIASPFLSSEQVIRETIRFASSYAPTGAAELRRVLEQVVNARGPVTLLAAVGLLWSSSGVFDLVQKGLNRAWHVSQPRPLWRQRMVSLVTVLAVGLLFGFSIFTSAFLRTGLRFRVEIGGGSIQLLSLFLTLPLNFALLSTIYKFFPYRRVGYGQVWGGALLASFLWEVAKILFVVYLLNFARLNLVYGSVGVVIALLLWGYVTAAILLFGAELAAVHSAKQTGNVQTIAYQQKAQGPPTPRDN